MIVTPTNQDRDKWEISLVVACISLLLVVLRLAMKLFDQAHETGPWGVSRWMSVSLLVFAILYVPLICYVIRGEFRNLLGHLSRSDPGGLQGDAGTMVRRSGSRMLALASLGVLVVSSALF